MTFKAASTGFALVLACSALSGAQEQAGSQPFRGLLDPDFNAESVATTRAAYQAGLVATDAELAKLQAEIAPMHASQLAVNYQEGTIVEGTRNHCLVTIGVGRKSIARILNKDSLRLEVQLAILLEVVNDELDHLEGLLANQVSTQNEESVKRGLEWAATLARIRKGDGERRVQMAAYVLARIPTVTHSTNPN